MRKKILIVDDESSIREALKKVLRAENYAVVSAESGQEVIDKFGAERIDLALIDLGLLVKDGWRNIAMECLARVAPYLPIIIITGRSNQREMVEKMGVDAIMEKPLDVPRLLQIIRELIDEPTECRVRRGSSFQYVGCDNELFLKSLNDRFATRLTLPELKSH